jgi:hypothetical protein
MGCVRSLYKGQELKFAARPQRGKSLNESEHKVKKLTGLTIVMVIAALALAPAAFAQSTGTGYGGTAGGVAGQVAQGGNGNNPNGTAGTGSVATRASGNSGFLPFTGLDVALLIGGGLLLLGTGVGLSRLVGRQSAA